LLADLGILVVLAAAPAAGPSWRLYGEPQDTAESALREAVSRGGVAAVQPLTAVSQQYPDTVISGLARLAAGLSLVDAGRYAEALAHLTHADVQRTLLRDRALLAQGQAQEGLDRLEAAARSYAAAGMEPDSAVACVALPRAAEAFLHSRQPDAAVPLLERALALCPRDAPSALLALGEAHLARGDRRAAAAAFARLDREQPASAAAAEARRKRPGLASLLPPASAEERARARLDRGTALLAAGRSAEAIEALRGVPLASLPPVEADLVRVRLARALYARRRAAEAQALVRKVASDSPHAAEAAFLLARERARRSRNPQPYEEVADRFPGTPWAEESLLAIANHYQKDALDEPALPWWRHLMAEFPDGRYAERATWRVGWADYRAGRYEQAAQALESTARLRPPSAFTPGFLYWAARSRLSLGQGERARQLLEETVQRYKHTYHGLRAREVLARLGGAVTLAPQPVVVADGAPPEPDLPEPRASRLRQLLLIERLEEAADELRLLPESPRVFSTSAWIDWKLGRFRPAIIAMKRAYPEWIGEAGDRLPDEVWRILFPLRYGDELRRAAEEEGLEASLVAALILQESSFDAAALSHAGARGLMQVMPATGRRIARDKGQRFRRAALHDPRVSLDFGTHYLRKMSDRYDGSVEKVLAAYNAGPERVDAWAALWPGLSAEEFIESIPFTETRTYEMIVLASREEYRRLYGLGRTVPGPVAGGPRP
jgi:soluble lytic murein transglycosylase